MGFSNGCKIHPYQPQKQGVCPSCLRDRLSRLCSTSFNEASSVITTYYSSNSSSPPRRPMRNGSVATGVVKSSSFMVRVGDNYGLKKSRSITFVPRKIGDGDVQGGDKKKMKAFWSKLLRLKGKKKDVVMHSSSMRL